MRRGYVYVISKQILKIIKAQEDILFSEDAQMKYGPFDVGKILTATSPKEIDELYCRYVSAYILSTREVTIIAFNSQFIKVKL